MLVTAVGLRLRRDVAGLFLSGRYLPLVTETSVHAELLAFARILDGRAVLVVVPRLAAPLVTDGAAAAARRRRVEDVAHHPAAGARTAGRSGHEITGATLEPTVTAGEEWLFAGQVFTHLPVGILTSEPNGPRR